MAMSGINPTQDDLKTKFGGGAGKTKTPPPPPQIDGMKPPGNFGAKFQGQPDQGDTFSFKGS
jgi:hypothetical protein